MENGCAHGESFVDLAPTDEVIAQSLDLLAGSREASTVRRWHGARFETTERAQSTPPRP